MGASTCLCASNRLKCLILDFPNSIPIEHRPPREACTLSGAIMPLEETTTERRQATVLFTPEGIDAYNPSFDVTPAELITAIVTEKGVAVATKLQGGETTFDLSGVV